MDDNINEIVTSHLCSVRGRVVRNRVKMVSGRQSVVSCLLAVRTTQQLTFEKFYSVRQALHAMDNYTPTLQDRDIAGFPAGPFFWGGGRLPPQNQLLPPKIFADFIFNHPEPPPYP